MFFTAELILQLTAGNMLPPPVLEIHLILLSLRAKFNFMSSCSNTNSRNKRVTCEWTRGKQYTQLSLLKQEERLERRRLKQFSRARFVTRRRSAL